MASSMRYLNLFEVTSYPLRMVCQWMLGHLPFRERSCVVIPEVDWVLGIRLWG